MNEKFDPIAVSLPADFPFKTNAGLQGNMQFFVTSDDHQMTVSAPVYEGDRVSFVYRCWDSDEGSVSISYVTASGAGAENPDPEETWDVEISSGSDVWGLNETATAVRDAIALHRALARDVPFAR